MYIYKSININIYIKIYIYRGSIKLKKLCFAIVPFLLINSLVELVMITLQDHSENGDTVAVKC